MGFLGVEEKLLGGVVDVCVVEVLDFGEVVDVGPGFCGGGAVVDEAGEDVGCAGELGVLDGGGRGEGEGWACVDEYCFSAAEDDAFHD
jgi:hypothetical protein